MNECTCPFEGVFWVCSNKYPEMRAPLIFIKTLRGWYAFQMRGPRPGEVEECVGVSLSTLRSAGRPPLRHLACFPLSGGYQCSCCARPCSFGYFLRVCPRRGITGSKGFYFQMALEKNGTSSLGTGTCVPVYPWPLQGRILPPFIYFLLLFVTLPLPIPPSQ